MLVKVKIKSWEEMVDKYGLDKDGDIAHNENIEYFVEEMKHLCGKIIDLEVDEYDGECSYEYWTIFPWMYDRVDEDKTKNIKENEMEIKITKINKNKKLPEIHIGMIVQLDNKYDCIIVCIGRNNFKVVDLKDGYVYGTYSCLENIRNDITQYYDLAELILEEI